jgi:metal-responsive CopG/Arc/MetJ family transcriptional regulator
MKTAVSIPEDVYAEAEDLARRLEVSRSRLYTDALREYIARHDPDTTTELLNRVYDEIDSAPDPAVAAASRRLLARVEW